MNYVYFARRQNPHLIKIGRSKNPPARMVTLKSQIGAVFAEAKRARAL